VGSPPGLAGATFSAGTRLDAWSRLRRSDVDLLVIGAGITGAAVAYCAAARGSRVALVDKADFAGGTSSRSSRLIHGGLRYLLHGQVRLVTHSLQEQVRLSRLAPHLVRPQAFLLPLYRDAPVPPVLTRALMFFYHTLRPLNGRLTFQRLDPAATLAQERLLRREGLLGGLLYYEYVTHDARLVLETVLAAVDHGALALNYVGFVDFLTSRGRVVGGILQDQLTGEVLDLRARAVVNAAGPWSDLLVRPLAAGRRHLRLSKGSHILIPRARLPLAHGITLLARDGRGLMARPDGDVVFVGPTETEYDGDPSAVAADEDDRDYLLAVIRGYFPEANLGPADVVGMMVGLRPLYDQSSRPAGEISRAYETVWGPPGLLSVLGGKLTLHRRAAEDALRFLERECGWSADGGVAEPLPGARWRGAPDVLAEELRRAGARPESVSHLLQTYGSRAALFLDLLRAAPGSAGAIVGGLPYIWAEASFAREHEMAIRPEDFLHRRSDLALQAAAAGRTVPDQLAQQWTAAGKVAARRTS